MQLEERSGAVKPRALIQSPESEPPNMSGNDLVSGPIEMIVCMLRSQHKNFKPV